MGPGELQGSVDGTSVGESGRQSVLLSAPQQAIPMVDVMRGSPSESESNKSQYGWRWEVRP
jgi:hypothetical protein